MQLCYSNNITFNSKCAEIKLGQDACNLVNREFPHVSLTKFKPLFNKCFDNKYKKQISATSLINLTIKFNNERPNYGGKSINVVEDVLEFAKKGFFNCFESSVITDLVLRINGIKNTWLSRIKQSSNFIDHEICLFNKDGSEFDGNIINNRTIIVDTWAGKCDLANNMFREYKEGPLAKLFKLDNSDGFNLDSAVKLKLTEEDIINLTKKYPNLIMK